MSPDTAVPFQMEDLAGPAKEAPKPPKLSEKDLRNLRRQFMTVRLAEVAACGHKFDSRRPPNGNCPDCWYAFFKTAVDLGALHNELTEVGSKGLINKYGKKYVKYFHHFLIKELASAPVKPVREEDFAPVGFDEAVEKMKIENGIIPPAEEPANV